MRVTFARYEYVDEVHTLTLAEGPGESGTLIHLMRATWEDDADHHEVCNTEGISVAKAVRAWTLSNSDLVLTFQDSAAPKLGLPIDMNLDLDLPDPQRAEIHEHLAQILIDVPEG
jgi:Immunity protein 10